MSRKPSKPETRIEDYLDVMTGGNAVLPQPILRIEFYYAFLAGMTVELPQPILDDEKLLAKICGMEVEAPTYIPGLFPRLYAYMAKKGGQDVQVPDPILRLERYWYDYSAGEAPSVQEYTGAVPVTFTADGTPLLDYLISGNMVQSGTPTPDNPIMPQGTGERTGNLFDFEQLKNAPSGAIGSITFSHVLTLQLKANTYYTMASNGTGSTSSTPADLYRSIYFNATAGESSANKNNPVTLLTDSTGVVRIGFFSERTNAQQYLNGEAQLWINEGSTALPYEPYGYKIPISSANTTTPVYLGEVETTRKIRKWVLTGEEESWSKDSDSGQSARYYIAISDTESSTQNLLSSHFTQSAQYGIGTIRGYRKTIIFSVDKTIYATIADFKSYLAQQYANGTPVTIWYALVTPTTGIVNEPLCKIGDYSDTLSMEQAGVQIPTANGSTTLDVETTVKPSEVYIKYRGEAVATLSMLSAEVSSPEETPEEADPEETEEEENER
jgi:hypothetical protein